MLYQARFDAAKADAIDIVLLNCSKCEIMDCLVQTAHLLQLQ
jgi:hypothetical protein